MTVSWDDDIPNIWKVIKFMFQPPISDRHTKQIVTGPVNTESVPGVRDGGLLIAQKLGLLPNE